MQQPRMPNPQIIQRISFISNPQQRSGLHPEEDARLLNMMVESLPSPISENKRYFVKSRPGMGVQYTLTTGVPRGLFNWIVGGVSHVFSVIGSNVSVYGTNVATLLTTTGRVGFTEFVASTGVVSLVMVDGTNGYVFSDPNTPVHITDANFPSPHLPYPIFLDGYLVLGAGTEDIHNSDLDNPAAWTNNSFISAEMYPDSLTCLTKNNNYIYAVGTNSIEYFYDAGNAPPYSPLSRNDSAVQQFGSSWPNTVVQTEGQVILVGDTDSGSPTVWTIDGFKSKDISIPSVQDVLVTEGSNLKNANAYVIRTMGQKLYVLCLTTRTLVYSFTTEMWSEWASGVDNSVPFLGFFGVENQGNLSLLDRNGGFIYTMNSNYYQDNATPFRCEIVTAKQDFETINRKTMSRLAVLGDIPDSSGTNNTILVSWSDDDYKTWAQDRNLTFNYDFPVITQLGAFRRRAFRFRYASPFLLRLEGFEVNFNKGIF